MREPNFLKGSSVTEYQLMGDGIFYQNVYMYDSSPLTHKCLRVTDKDTQMRPPKAELALLLLFTLSLCE